MTARSSAPPLTDPRPGYASATAWVTELIRNVDDAQRHDSTPCTEYDVDSLIGHLVATVDRARVVGAGGDFATVPVIAERRDADAYAEAATAAIQAWDAADALTKTVTVPWGEVPGAGALWGYLNETLVHGWDLAVATGQPTEADPTVAEPVLSAVRSFLPADIRHLPDIPFDAVVPPSPQAGPTERLANWSGRHSPSSGD